MIRLDEIFQLLDNCIRACLNDLLVGLVELLRQSIYLSITAFGLNAQELDGGFLVLMKIE